MRGPQDLAAGHVAAMTDRVGVVPSRLLSLVLADVVAERRRQNEVHGDFALSSPTLSDPVRLTVLVEEVGEVAHELTYDAGRSSTALYAELVQVAACAVAWAEALRQTMPPRVCRVAGCDRPASAEDWCPGHVPHGEGWDW